MSSWHWHRLSFLSSQLCTEAEKKLLPSLLRLKVLQAGGFWCLRRSEEAAMAVQRSCPMKWGSGVPTGSPWALEQDPLPPQHLPVWNGSMCEPSSWLGRAGAPHRCPLHVPELHCVCWQGLGPYSPLKEQLFAVLIDILSLFIEPSASYGINVMSSSFFNRVWSKAIAIET